MRTAVVILNWNTRDYLARFLPPLLESLRGRDADVVVADNASTDGSRELLAERFPQVRTILLADISSYIPYSDSFHCRSILTLL